MAITYAPTTNFGLKDSLPTNDSDKVIRGSEFTTEFTAIQTAFSLAAPNASPTFTGTVTIPTADINGGNIDGTVIGAAAPAAGSFTTGQFGTSLNVDGTVTADGLTVEPSASTGFTVGADGTNTYVNFEANSIAASVQQYYGQAAGTAFYAVGAKDSGGTLRTAFRIDGGGDISFYEDTGTTPKFFWDASAEALQLKSGSLLELERPDGAISSKIYMQAGASGGLAFDNLNGDGFEFKYAGADQVVIDSAGNVGIGRTSVSYRLDVKQGTDGTTAGFAGSTYGIRFDNGGAFSSGMSTIHGVDDTLTSSYQPIMLNGSDVRIGTGATERMRIDASGRLLVGTTSNYGGEALQIDANSVGATVYTAYISNTNTSTSAYNVMRWAQGAAGSATGMIGTGGSAASNAAFRNSFVVGTQSSSPLVFATADAERARIDSSGNLLVGTTVLTDISSSGTGNEGAYITPDGTIGLATSNQGVGFFNRKTSDGTIFQFRKDGTAVGSIGTYSSGIFIHTTDGTDAGLGFRSTQLVPCTSTGANDDNRIDLGAPAARFDDVYATNGTIQTSDANEKQDIRDLSEAEARVAQAAKALLKAFRWKDSVAEKGDDARIHFGIIAQDLQAAFEAEGLDAGRYAMFIHSTWTDKEAGEERSRMGVRYSELLAFIIAAL